jgi:murein DD-endopeptidase MepM/ murein hydrolase activator NlpD
LTSKSVPASPAQCAPLRRDMRTIIFYVVGMLTAIGCSKHKLPTEKYYQFDYPAKYSHDNDTLKVEIKNPLNCPLRISISSPDRSLTGIVAKFATLTLKEKRDTTIKYYLAGHNKIVLNFNSIVGDLNKEIVKEKFMLPFPKNRSYRIVQGYNGSHSHNTDNSRYAIDFDLKINDTICSAADGYVVGVIKDYQLSGTTKDWIDYANYITIYHPKSGLFTQYVHLIRNGSFVKVGDSVSKGQPIGLSGMTGYTTEPHLHLNVLKPDKDKGWISPTSNLKKDTREQT